MYDSNLIDEDRFTGILEDVPDGTPTRERVVRALAAGIAEALGALDGLLVDEFEEGGLEMGWEELTELNKAALLRVLETPFAHHN